MAPSVLAGSLQEEPNMFCDPQFILGGNYWWYKIFKRKWEAVFSPQGKILLLKVVNFKNLKIRTKTVHYKPNSESANSFYGSTNRSLIYTDFYDTHKKTVMVCPVSRTKASAKKAFFLLLQLCLGHSPMQGPFCSHENHSLLNSPGLAQSPSI